MSRIDVNTGHDSSWGISTAAAIQLRNTLKYFDHRWHAVRIGDELFDEDKKTWCGTRLDNVTMNRLWEDRTIKQNVNVLLRLRVELIAAALAIVYGTTQCSRDRKACSYFVGRCWRDCHNEKTKQETIARPPLVSNDSPSENEFSGSRQFLFSA